MRQTEKKKNSAKQNMRTEEKEQKSQSPAQEAGEGVWVSRSWTWSGGRAVEAFISRSWDCESRKPRDPCQTRMMHCFKNPRALKVSMEPAMSITQATGS